VPLGHALGKLDGKGTRADEGHVAFENVEKLKWTVTSQPFVSKERHPHRQQERDGWYITTHSSTPFKKKQIEDLSKKFKLKLKVEIV